jgi:hypothetical protein
MKGRRRRLEVAGRKIGKTLRKGFDQLLQRPYHLIIGYRGEPRNMY